MFGFKDISIDFLTGSPVVVWFVLGLLLLLAIYLYKRTNPPLPLYIRIILGGLRLIAILALMLTLANPIISYTRQFERQKKVTVLVDASSSMEKLERGKSRNERVDSLLSSRDFNRLQGNSDITTHYFGGNVADERVTVLPHRTALGDALDIMQKRQMASPSDYWLLLSDGNSNSGQDPRRAAGQLGQPVVTVDMSSDTGAFDIGISDLQYNPVLFDGQSTEINLKLNWHDAPEGNVTVRLLDSNRVVAQTNFGLNQREGLGDVTLSYTPQVPGQKILKVEIPRDSTEENQGNNQRSFSVKVLKSRLLILLVTEAPDYEVGFLKRILEQSDKYEVTLLVTGSKAGNLARQFPSRQTELNRYDLVILHDPDPTRLEARGNVLGSYLSEKGGAVWVLMGQRFADRGPVNWLSDLLPFSQTRRRPIEYISFHGEPSEGNLFHPAVRLADNPSAIRKVWSELPPFKALVRCDSTHPQASVLAYATLSSGEASKYPILGYRRFGPGKLMASAALPFWTWGFVNLGFGEDPGHYGKFLEGAISWLTVSDDLEPVRVKPEKNVFHRGETIRFEGFAFDLGFRPIPSATGTVVLRSATGDAVYETDLLDQGEGAFKAQLNNVTPGEYDYLAVIEKDGRILKEETGKIIVEPFSLEELDRSGDPATLMALSEVTGGSYFRYEQFDAAVNALDLSTVAVQQKGEITLLNELWLLIIFIVAICLEWLIRKINQLL